MFSDMTSQVNVKIGILEESASSSCVSGDSGAYPQLGQTRRSEKTKRHHVKIAKIGVTDEPFSVREQNVDD
jgi:hypothetical protein